ncbi:MAG: efflux RND transporter permease subunit [Planctomycetaceae bacterium]|nr:efflux RND transporter permease subunit [Planctomycetaceae bacterium]
MRINSIVRFCLENPLVVFLVTLFAVGWGLYHAPLRGDIPGVERDPVAVDAIPNLGENQQIVFTEWMGRSPRDVEDQVTYPLSIALLGIPDVRTIRSSSMFGHSSIYVIFDEGADFYATRTRILEKLSSLPADTLPEGVSPQLGPDATPLGQVFWYTLEGRDPETGEALGGWNLEELRSIQDWQVKRFLAATDGVAEVASIGGFVREYHIDVDPDAMRLADVTLHQVREAAAAANAEVGARTIERNGMEYVVRGAGFAAAPDDFADAVITVRNGNALRIRDVGTVTFGPAPRAGALDKGGIEAVGGVVVARYGANPMAVIAALKERIAELAPGLPQKRLDDGRASRVTVVPFYDRSALIDETLDTLDTAIGQQVLITVIVIVLLLKNLRTGILVSSLMPLAVLLGFGMMKLFGVDANIVSLSGIAIAVGTISDMGIVLCENIVQKLKAAPPGARRVDIIHGATVEVGGAVATAVLTTVVSFLPIFMMIGAEGKLFKPLAYTKTFVLIASIVATLTILPSLALLILGRRREVGTRDESKPRGAWQHRVASLWQSSGQSSVAYLISLILAVVLAADWMPLGVERGFAANCLVVVAVVLALFLGIELVCRHYTRILAVLLRRKLLFLAVPALLCVASVTAWLGWNRLWGWLPRTAERLGISQDAVRLSRPWVIASHAFPGFGKEFMPPLDEGSFLSMPTLMPHAAFSTVVEMMGRQDELFAAVPEVDVAVGKAGRADSPLDPAPTTMIETVINYQPEYLLAADGSRLTFRFDPASPDVFRSVSGQPLRDPDGNVIPTEGRFVRDEGGQLIPDASDRAFRLWRPFIKKPDDIWAAVEKAGRIPGMTGAPKLYPIEARNVMLQTGLRAAMGVKIQGSSLESIAEAAVAVEGLLRDVPGIDAASVSADRPVGKPYIEVIPDRQALIRYGVTMADVMMNFEAAVGGEQATTVIANRERYAVRVRYPRELRDSPEALARVLVPTAHGHVPLGEVAEIRLTAGPEMIAAEDTFLVGYVVFGARAGYGEVEVVESAAQRLEQARRSGAWTPPEGVSWSFSGSYENQVRSEKKLAVILPAALLIIFLLVYLQFRSVSTSLIVFSGIPLALAGGMLLLWLYGQPWFLDGAVLGVEWRELFQIRQYHLSVAVWVGFLALFGIATDDGVVMGTYLDQVFEQDKPQTVEGVRAAVIEAGNRRVRPCLMTSATTLLALLPILTSHGRGSEVMVPMAIPSVGGMSLTLLSMFIVPVLYSWRRERELRRRSHSNHP